MEEYFKPARNVIFERFVFGNCKRNETKLREKAASCEYGQLKEELIRYRLVLGGSDESVRRHLLRQKDLTLASAVEICRAAEMTDMRIQAITQDRPVETVHATDGCQPRPPPWQDRTEFKMRPQTRGTAPHADSAATLTGVGVIFAQLLEKTVGAVGP